MATGFSHERLGRRRNSGPAVLMSLKLKNNWSKKFSFVDSPQLENDEEEGDVTSSQRALNNQVA